MGSDRGGRWPGGSGLELRPSLPSLHVPIFYFLVPKAAPRQARHWVIIHYVLIPVSKLRARLGEVTQATGHLQEGVGWGAPPSPVGPATLTLCGFRPLQHD